jgi:RNA polymerase sigma factor (sigma-70 family)
MYGQKRPRASGPAKSPFSKKTIFDLPEPSRSIMLLLVGMGGSFDPTRPQRTYGGNGPYYVLPLSGDFVGACCSPSRLDTVSVATERDDQPAAYRAHAAAVEDRQRAGWSLGPLRTDPRNALVARHQYLVDLLVSKFLRLNFEFTNAAANGKRDEIREAMQGAAREGLARAVVQFKPELGKFYSYAWTAIWRALLAEQTKRAEWSAFIGAELDAPVGSAGHEVALLDLLVDDTGDVDPARIVDDRILPHFDILTERERYVISARYLDEPRQQRDIAAELGCTPQNVSLIEESALAKLRKAITGRTGKPAVRRKRRQRRETPAIPPKEQPHESKRDAAALAA